MGSRRKPVPDPTGLRVLLLRDKADTTAPRRLRLDGRSVIVGRASADDPLPSTRPPWDVILASYPIDGGRASVAVACARPCAPADAARLLAQVAGGHARALAESLGVPPDLLARSLMELLPDLSSHAVALDGARSDPRPRFSLVRLLTDLEQTLIRVMLVCAESDRQCARLLGLSEGTLRSKMKKWRIRSPRAHRPSSQRDG